jgi:3-phosphoshikimate 1-carboxyvinyltransferase
VIPLPKVILPAVMEAPVSKSHMQRELLLSLLAATPSQLFGDFNSLPDDVRSAIRCIERFGAQVTVSPNHIDILPPGPTEIQEELSLHVGESGFLIRNVVSVGFLFARKLRIHAEGTLLNRALHLNEELFSQLGLVQHSGVQEWPLILEQKQPMQLEIELDASTTSQIASGVLMRLACALGNRKLCLKNLVSIPYFEMTLEQLTNRGLHLSWDARCIAIQDDRPIQGGAVKVQRDWSGAANLLCVGAITGSITVKGLDFNTKQADERILDVLNAYGADIQIEGDTISVCRGMNAAFSVDITHSPDLFPLLCVLAASAVGKSRIKGTERLTTKESDRLQASMAMLDALGIECELAGNEIFIMGGIRHKQVHIETFKDHRMVLAALVLAAMDGMQVSVSEFASLDKSFPQLKPLLQV